jgi:hypothetical protein
MYLMRGEGPPDPGVSTGDDEAGQVLSMLIHYIQRDDLPLSVAVI